MRLQDKSKFEKMCVLCREALKTDKAKLGCPTRLLILKLKQVIFGWVNYFRIGNMKKVIDVEKVIGIKDY
ncbi:group II intron maturase-specific domain-containing protein [Cytobacillus spongiae]|uniref:group II intron maturase-specific domain-containing protein n=1 Tax=Cytobacillus spongiae TaxID=2901381 RepID=UPI0032C4560E